jgi:ABC-type transport system substrate-binding protein/ABC-type dipeptide/oligopeptide/nickel transport system permease subunit
MDARDMLRRVSRAWRRLLANRGAVVGAVIVVGLVAVALLAPAVSSKNPLVSDVEHGLSAMGAPLPPSAAAVLGTDQLGRDVWARVVAGAGTSLAIAALATLIALVIGLAIGLVAGYAGGALDSALMRLVDLVLAFPFLLLAILLASLFREARLASSDAPVFVTLGVLGWTTMARVIRGKARVLARSDMVTAARALGASPARIVMRHVLPNLAGLVIVVTALGFAQNLLSESVLSYVGLGPPPPTPTWGRMLYEGRAYYRTAPHLVLVPGIAILLAVIGFNLLGEGLRDAFDARDAGAAGDRRGPRGAAMKRASWPRVALVMVGCCAGCWAGCFAGCSPPDRGPRFRAAGASSPRDGGALRFAIGARLASLDPTISYDEYAYFILHPLFDTLVDFSPRGLDLIPRLAERWEVSPDGLTYTFVLRAGIAFSDGAPIIAAHFKYSLERALATPDSPFAEFLGDIEGARDVIEGKATACTGIAAVGRDRLVIKLARVNPAFLDVLAMPFATPQRAEHATAAGDQLRRQPDATGPFELDSWDEGNRIVLRRNPHYFDPARAHLDSITMLENVPRDTQFQMFERGELETAEKLTAPDYLFVMSEPAWQRYVHRAVSLNAYGSRMNVEVKPFNDRHVRQALNYALDKAHTARLLNGTTEPAHGILPRGLPGRDPDLAPYPHDVATARRMLAEAGYPDGLDVDYVTYDDEEPERVAQSLQSDLAEAGVRIHITVMSWAAFQTAIGQRSGPAFSYAGWIADFPDPTNFFEPRFHSRSIKPAGSTNDSFYSNPELDALLDDARQERDPDRRAAMYRDAERILYVDAPWIWDYHRLTIEVTQPYVRNFEPHPIWIRDYTSTWLDLGPDGKPVAR